MTAYVPKWAFLTAKATLLRTLSVTCLLYLAGCATTSTPRDVAVQVPVACVSQSDRPERPAFLGDGDLLVLDSYRATWALWGERLTAQGYIAKLETVVEGCARIPASK